MWKVIGSVDNGPRILSLAADRNVGGDNILESRLGESQEGVTYFKDVFMTLDKIKILFDEWRKEYNQVRPHSALVYHPPAPEAVMPVILT